MTNMFNAYGTNIKHTRKLHKLAREFYECLPYPECRHFMIIREMRGRKHQKQSLDGLSYNIKYKTLRYYERDENKSDIKMIMSELYEEFKLQ